ncbi:hypothetical protein [Pollutimonas bauzanensis]|uniref:Uncharacterized protein n=1 Tax=Pollutimonas bauzanensis TaxID=658167 RepID=A0A1M5W3S8_9BURK|nr:hypothetical protein [Pollutimonas bauzanensis]SHH81844.1 hypothetical protein SAMN04488135_10564 [Pollutimonas bauzanensis]
MNGKQADRAGRESGCAERPKNGRRARVRPARPRYCTSIGAAGNPVDGRLPMVLCEPQLQALKNIGQRLDCTLVEVLFAVFGMVIKGFLMLGTVDTLVALDSRALGGFFDGMSHSVAYAVRIPQGALRRPLPNAAGEAPGCMGAPIEVSSPGGMAAFIYSRRCDGEDQVVRQFGAIPRSDRIDRAAHAAFDLVVEVTEFDRHVLIECFFCPVLVHRHTVASLLFRYARGLRDVESSQAK